VNATEHCGLGYTIGTGWALLLGNQSISLWLRPTSSTKAAAFSAQAELDRRAK